MLDSVAADSAQSEASRRDLDLFNWLFGTRRWLEKTIRPLLRAGERVLELGADQGHVARDMLERGLPWDALDFAAAPNDWPAHSRWIQGNARLHIPDHQHQVIVANLLLHDFDSVSLRRLGYHLQENSRVIIVSDLCRSELRVGLFALLCALTRANPVTRDDGALSIRAGFRGDELPHALGLSRRRWRWKVQRTLSGAYRMVAVRRS